ncbi:MAG: hypothetical protein JNJ46_29880 [Myxococcales bacterium]|nr:hypothetical protein [Myxococcales bacterium]
MRVHGLCLAGLLVLFHALSAHAARVELEPSELLIRAESGGTIQRTLRVRTSPDVSAVAVEPSDLVIDTQPQALSLPAMRLTRSDATQGTGSLLWEYPLHIDLGNLPAGEYSGTLVFVHADGALKAPVKIQIRHRPWLPLLVLVAGILVGVGLSMYRAHGRPRDLLLMRLGFLRSYLQQDPLLRDSFFVSSDDENRNRSGMNSSEEKGITGLSDSKRSLPAHPFRAQLDVLLLQVELSLQAEQLETARGQLAQADELFRRFSSARTEWAKQLSYLARLHERIHESAPVGSVVRKSLLAQVDELFAGAPSQASPQALAQAAQQVVELLSAHGRASSRLLALEQQIKQPGTAPRWSDTLADLRSRTDGKPPALEALALVCKDADAAIAALQAELAATAGEGPDDVPATSPGILHKAAVAGEPGASPIEPVPAVYGLVSSREAPKRAAQRLQFFLYASYGMLLVVLAGTGLNEVYGKKFTFGADPFTDYLTLLLWGFGAEATRDSIVATLRGLGGERGKDAAAAPAPSSPSRDLVEAPAKPSDAPPAS